MKYHIGIDPDTVKSGVGVWDGENKMIQTLEALEFWHLIQFLIDNQKDIKEVRLEGGWLNKSNWHLSQIRNGKSYALNARESAEAGRDLGRNHQTGILIEEFLIKFKIPHKVVKPMTGNTWKTNAAVFNKMTGWTKASNPEKRDAIMLVFGLK